MKQKTIPIRITAALAFLIGLSILAYYWKLWGDQGLAADANRTDGHIPNVQLLIAALAGLLVIGAVTVVVRSKRRILR